MEDSESNVSLPLSAPSKAVAVEILVHGAQSRARLARRMELSPATLTRLVKPLLEGGVLIESDAIRSPGRGRSSLPLDVVPGRYKFVGVKLTEETIYAVVTDVRSRVIDQIQVPIGSLDVSDVVNAVRDIVMNFQSRIDQPLDAVGVTVGGRVVAGDVVADSSFLQWRDVPFLSLLRETLKVPVYLDNDVVGLTKAQQWFGHGKGYPNFALLTVGAGVGYGVVINNEMVPTFGNPLSHYPVDPSGPLCPLGHRGCMTAFLSSRSITAAVSAAHGRVIEYEDVLELARAGDAPAARVVREAARALGRAVSAITAFTGVKRIILSGEGVRIADAARSSVEAGRGEYDVDGALQSELIVRPMDFVEWARGAAVIAIQKEFPVSSLGDVAGNKAVASRNHLCKMT